MGYKVYYKIGEDTFFHDVFATEQKAADAVEALEQSNFVAWYVWVGE